MRVYRLASGITIGLMLTVATAWADPGPHQRTVKGSFAGSFSPSTFDPNNDGQPANLNLYSTKTLGGRGTAQALIDSLPPLQAPVACPAGTTEFPYSSSFTVTTDNSTLDQLHSAGGEGTGRTCLNTGSFEFTFESTQDVIGGTGKLLGAKGTIESKGTGAFIACDSALRCTGSFSGEYTATLFLQ